MKRATWMGGLAWAATMTMVMTGAATLPILAQTYSDPNPGKTVQFALTSTAFTEGQNIPADYTCDGRNVSPPLAWSNSPEGTRTFAILCDDPEAPTGTFTHWVLFNIPGEIHALAEDLAPMKQFETGMQQGLNDFKKIGYRGPCPPTGAHHYHFRIFALDAPLKIAGDATKSQVTDAMAGHILAQAELVGIYKHNATP